MTLNSPRFDAVLFDCDGVLVDSEPITNAVLRDILAEQGWQLTSEECVALFIGKAVKDEIEIIEQKTGRAVDDAWLAAFRARRDAELVARVAPIHGIEEVLTWAYAATDGRIACASGADRGKVELQLRKTGLIRFFEGRIFSGHEMPRSKPAPDVYLAAAAALGVSPNRCAVVEDTPTGVTAGVAAGCTVFGYHPGAMALSTAQSLVDAGAVRTFENMQNFPNLLRF